MASGWETARIEALSRALMPARKVLAVVRGVEVLFEVAMVSMSADFGTKCCAHVLSIPDTMEMEWLECT